MGIHTTSIDDLILNAAALAFVLEVDQIVFKLVTPMRIVRLVRALEPLPIVEIVRMRGVSPWFFMLLVLAFLVIMDVLYLHPFVLNVREVLLIISCSDGCQAA